MGLHKEISFATEICQHLADFGWLHAEGDADGRALVFADVLAGMHASQSASALCGGSSLLN